MSSKTEIANLALQLLGQAPNISNVDTDGTQRAISIRNAYDATRKAALRAHAWNFATVRTTLASTGTTPAWGFAYRHQLPSDYLGQLRFDRTNHGSRKPPHRVTTDTAESAMFVDSDEGATLYVEYVKDIANGALFDPMFVEFFAAKLAEKVAYQVTGKPELARDMRDYAKDLARDARWADAVDTGRDPPDEGEFLAARAI
jgi:hypothetical protein